jgi:hypothetical protein
MNPQPIFRLASIAALAAGTLASQAVAQTPQTSAVEHSLVGAPANSLRIFDDGHGPVARLQDGQEFHLLALPDALKKQIEAHAALVANAEPSTATAGTGMRAAANTGAQAAAALPDVVDNRRFHGPLRNQAQRGTCVSHSTAAAVEGVYRRVDGKSFQNLDLSEQWANHIQKMVILAGSPYTDQTKRVSRSWQRENEPGCWAGSFNHYLIRVLQQYGLTEEAVMAYIPSGDYENNPYFDPNDPAIEQWDVDTFNLSPYLLPPTALEAAPYRPVDVTLLSQAQLQNPAVIEQIVAAGSDVIFDMALVEDQYTNSNNAWAAGTSGKVRGGHSMLIVGYNHSKQYFLVRNSWGYCTECKDGGYTRISYDYVKRFGFDASFVQTVADPSQDAGWARTLIGRWDMGLDGDEGVLDIYRLPGLFTSSEIGTTDRRLGTYWDSEGYAYRVNGYLDGSQFVFYIDWNNANASYGTLKGEKFVVELGGDAEAGAAASSDHIVGVGIASNGLERFQAVKLPATAPGR